MPQPEKPNILLLFTDQQRFDTIAACGFDHMLTPNLDRLVRDGCYFRNAYTPNPVCIPARHNLITGLTARFHGYSDNMQHPLDHRLPTLPRLLSDHGYETRAIGKMHFQPVRRHNGFDKMELMEEIPKFREADEYAMYLKQVGLGQVVNIHGVRNLLYMLPQQSLIPEEHHGSTWVGDRSSGFIRNNAGRHPFFLWSSWIAPHPPFDVPEPFAGMYRDRDLPTPLPAETGISKHAQSGRVHGDFPRGKEEAYIRRMRELYAGAISLVDKNVGKILDALEENGQLDNTLIVFSSDHGEMLGDHGTFQKMQPYDSCARIPFIVRYPARIKPGTVRNDFADLNDILPTILDVAGIDYPGPHQLPGASIFSDKKDRTHQYMEYSRESRRWCSMRDSRYKFNYFYAEGFEELYDMRDDPGETVNLLISDPENAEVRAARDRLREKLLAHEQKWGLEGCTTDTDFVKKEALTVNEYRRNGQFHIFPDRITNPDEKQGMNTLEQEVLGAVANEPLVRLHELDLECWQENGAPAELVEKIRKEKL